MINVEFYHNTEDIYINPGIIVFPVFTISESIYHISSDLNILRSFKPIREVLIPYIYIPDYYRFYTNIDLSELPRNRLGFATSDTMYAVWQITDFTKKMEAKFSLSNLNNYLVSYLEDIVISKNNVLNSYSSINIYELYFLIQWVKYLGLDINLENKWETIKKIWR